MRGTCDCGGVTVDIPGAPDVINACPCDYCRRVGARWGYFPAADTKVTGRTVAYRRAERVLDFRRCADCGTLIQWIDPTGRIPATGIHIVNFAPGALADIPVIVEP